MGKGDIIESMYGRHYRECINHNATRRLYIRNTTKYDRHEGAKQAFIPCGVICTCCGYTLVDKEWNKESAAKHRHKNWASIRT